MTGASFQLTATSATVVVAIISVVGSLLTVRLQRRIHVENRDDHQSTAAKVDALIDGQHEFRADIREIGADIRDLKVASRQHDKRIDDSDRRIDDLEVH